MQVRPRGVARRGRSSDAREGECGEERSKLATVQLTTCFSLRLLLICLDTFCFADARSRSFVISVSQCYQHRRRQFSVFESDGGCWARSSNSDILYLFRKNHHWTIAAMHSNTSLVEDEEHTKVRQQDCRSITVQHPCPEVRIKAEGSSMDISRLFLKHCWNGTPFVGIEENARSQI